MKIQEILNKHKIEMQRCSGIYWNVFDEYVKLRVVLEFLPFIEESNFNYFEGMAIGYRKILEKYGINMDEIDHNIECITPNTWWDLAELKKQTMKIFNKKEAVADE